MREGLETNYIRTVAGIAIELYLDPVSENKVMDFRQNVYASGVQPVLGLMNDKPHVSLAVIPSRDAKEILALTADFSKTISQMNFHLGAVGTFARPDNIIFLYPAPTAELLEVHRSFHRRLAQAGIESSHYYHPGLWVPHLTLEFNLPENDYYKAINSCKELFSPINGKFTELGVVAFRPIEYLDHFDLKER